MFGSDLENYINIISILFLEYETKNKKRVWLNPFPKDVKGKKKMLWTRATFFFFFFVNLFSGKCKMSKQVMNCKG